ncbi:MAG: hypothetical protein P8Y53_12545 [Pseudolabrys sp.]
MLSLVSGAVLVAVSGTGFWYFMPRNGMVHPWVTKPVLDSLIVIAIIGIAAVGLALIVSAVGG